jgi:hypothetical protein
MMRMKPIIIDNFLKEEDFKVLTDLICDTTTYKTQNPKWSYGQYYRAGEQGQETLITDYFFTHLFYVDGIPCSEHWPSLQHFVEKIQTIDGESGRQSGSSHWRLRGGKIKAMLRMRANLFVNTSTLYEYPLHADYPFSHTAAILSLNTCDGYTGVEDEDGIVQKYNSVANRVLIFDASERHYSTTTSDTNARFNLIMNFL